jgi:PKD repeat protein
VTLTAFAGTAQDTITRASYIRVEDNTPVVGDFLIASQPWPRVAYNSVRDEYLVVWGGDDSPASGQRISSSGHLIGSMIIFTSEASGPAGVAYDPSHDQYLIIWQKYDYDLDGYDVEGQMISGDGTLGNVIMLAPSGDLYSPVAAYNPSADAYLVTWIDGASDSLVAQVISGTGELIGSQFIIAGDAMEPNVIANPITGDWIVAYCFGWQQIQAQRIGDTGILAGSAVTVSQAAGYRTLPAVGVSSSGDYLVVWQDWRSGDDDIWGQTISAGGELTGGNVLIEGAVGSVQEGPRLAYQPESDTFLVVWQDNRNGTWDIYGASVSASGAIAGSDFAVTQAEGDQFSPSLAYSGPSQSFLIVWEDYRSGESVETYGRRFVAPISVDFAADPTSGVAPLVVTFTDTTGSRVDSRLWDFGDGTTSDLASPTHTYTQPGSYDVSLTVVSAGQNLVKTKPGFVLVFSNVGIGLTGRYFNNVSLSGSPVITRIDPQIDFSWGDGGPAPEIGSDDFSVRWTGFVVAQATEDYTFHTWSDDGVRLWVNGYSLISNWTDHGLQEDTGTIHLTAGQRYAILLEYYEHGGGADAHLEWSSPSTPQQVIPSQQLYPDVDLQATVETYPPSAVADGLTPVTVTIRLADLTGQELSDQPVYLQVEGPSSPSGAVYYWLDGQPAHIGEWVLIGSTDAAGIVTTQLSSIVADMAVVNVRAQEVVLSQGQVTFTPAEPVGLQLLLPGETTTPGDAPGKTGVPNDQTAGIPFEVTVRAVDAHWNTATGVVDTVILNGADPQVEWPVTVTLDNGIAMSSITFKTTTTQTLSATDLDHPAWTSIAVVTVTSNQPTVVELTASETAQPLASFPVTVTLRDAYGNSTTGQANFASSDAGASLPSGLVQGQSVMSAEFRNSGVQTLTVIIQPGDLAQTVTITVGTEASVTSNSWLPAGTYSYTSLFVAAGVTLTMRGDADTGTGVTLYADNVTVEPGATISADGQGYGSGQGPEAGADGGGGSHGGYGGITAGKPYGSARLPRSMGSGGGTSLYQTGGGAGGGAIHLSVREMLTLDGTLSADGESCTLSFSGACGGGAGGSLWIETGMITGTGILRANGGGGASGFCWPYSCDSGGGGGGRVALYVGDAFAGRIEAHGAGDNYWDVPKTTRGGPGTIYLENAGTVARTLLVDNNNLDGQPAGLEAGDYQFDKISLTRYGHLDVISTTSVMTLTESTLVGDGTARLTCEGTLAIPAGLTLSDTTIVVQGKLADSPVITTTGSGGLELHAHPERNSGVFTLTQLTVGPGTTVRMVPYIYGDSVYTDDLGLELRVNNLTVALDGLISADGKGYVGTYYQGNGPGGGQYPIHCVNCGGGGGHGGAGGSGPLNTFGGDAYGLLYEPRELGSAGGASRWESYYESSNGKSGGGAIHLVVSDTFVLDGFLSASGDSDTTGASAGGGAGGSIWIQAHTFSGNGAIRASGGGTSNGGGGGGGRIAVYADVNNFDGGFQVDGGGGFGPGQHGTVYDGAIDPARSTLTITPRDNVWVGEPMATLTVSLVTTAGLPVSNQPVSARVISGSGVYIAGHLSPTGTWTYIGNTTSDGMVTAVLSSTASGDKVIEARGGWVYVSNTAQITFIPQPFDLVRSTVIVTPTSVPADGLTPVTVTVTLRDQYSNTVSGMTVTLSAGEAGVTITQPVSPTDANGQAWGWLVSSVPQTATITASGGWPGMPLKSPAQVRFTELRPLLNLSPIAPTISVAPGNGAMLTITVRNDGKAPLTGTQMALPPHISWVSLSDALLPDLSPGESVVITLAAAPPTGTTLGVYRDFVTVTASNAESQRIALNARVRDATRAVQVTVSNDLGQALAGAHVSLVKQSESLTVTEGVEERYHLTLEADTATGGVATFSAVEVGAYDYRVYASSHDLLTGTVTVAPGEGAQTLSVTLHAQPAIAFEPSALSIVAQPGKIGQAQLVAHSAGAAPVDGVTVTLPADLPWLYLGFGQPPTRTLAAGDALSLTVYAAPPAQMGSSVYAGLITVTTGNAGSAVASLSVKVTAVPTGTLRVHVASREDAPVAAARVKLLLQTGQASATSDGHDTYTAQTGTDGAVTFAGITPGPYSYWIEADNYNPENGTVNVQSAGAQATASAGRVEGLASPSLADGDNGLDVTLIPRPFTAFWSVNSINDQYQITLTLQFTPTEPSVFVEPGCFKLDTDGLLVVRNPSDVTLSDLRVSVDMYNVTFSLGAGGVDRAAGDSSSAKEGQVEWRTAGSIVRGDGCGHGRGADGVRL